jgi:hypothetical protein
MIAALTFDEGARLRAIWHWFVLWLKGGMR